LLVSGLGKAQRGEDQCEEGRFCWRKRKGELYGGADEKGTQ